MNYNVRLNKNGKLLLVQAKDDAFVMNYKGSVEKTINFYAKWFSPDKYYNMLVEYGAGWLEAIQKTVKHTENLERLVKVAPDLSLN